MYIPKLFKMADAAEINDFIQQNSFVTLISVNADGSPVATHIPIEIVFLNNNLFENSITQIVDSNDFQPFIAPKTNFVLRGHVSRANPHVQLLAENPQALIIFQGAHSYVSSSWYTDPNVSTWNYSAVHVYGTVRALSENELLENVTKLTERYESGVENPYFVGKMPAEMVRRELRGIVGFELTPTDIQAKAKLSQNRKPADYQRVIENLEKSADPQAREVAAQMQKNLSKI